MSYITFLRGALCRWSYCRVVCSGHPRVGDACSCLPRYFLLLCAGCILLLLCILFFTLLFCVACFGIAWNALWPFALQVTEPPPHFWNLDSVTMRALYLSFVPSRAVPIYRIVCSAAFSLSCLISLHSISWQSLLFTIVGFFHYIMDVKLCLCQCYSWFDTLSGIQLLSMVIAFCKISTDLIGPVLGAISLP